MKKNLGKLLESLLMKCEKSKSSQDIICHIDVDETLFQPKSIYIIDSPA